MNLVEARGAGGFLQVVANLVAFAVDRGNHRTGRNSQAEQRGFGKLQARFDGLRHRIGGAEPVKMARMVGVAGARNDQHIGAHGAHMGDDVVDQLVVVDGDDDAGGICQAAGFEKFLVCGVAVIDVLTLPAVVRHGRGIRNRRRGRKCRAA